MASKSEGEKKREEYEWPLYPPEIPKVQYQLKQLPLQREIGDIRNYLSKSISKYEGNWTTIKRNSRKKYENLKDSLSSYGIQKDSLVVQGGAVGGAVLLGYFAGRKKTLLKRLMYPVMGGALVGGAFYLSYETNRKQIKEEFNRQLNKIWPKKK